MTAFEKSLRALDEDALRAGAEELLALLKETDGIRRGRGGPGGGNGRKRHDVAAARVSALISADGFPEKNGGETSTASAVDASASDGMVSETARARRAYPETDGGPAAEDTARKDDEALPGMAFPEVIDGEARDKRKERKSQEHQKVQDDREDKEDPADREDREKPESRKDREDRRDRENPEKQLQALRAESGEPVGQAETRSLEERLQSVSQQRRVRVQQSGENGAHTAAFLGPERQYEGAAGARGSEMRRISDYFRRDSRRYDTGFTTY